MENRPRRKHITRRKFLTTSTNTAIAAVSSAAILPSGRLFAAGGAKIKVGQIGTGHGHASGKMAVYRASDDYEVVGIVEDDPALRERAQGSKTYQGLEWMTRDQLLETPGLQLVAVESKVPDLLDNAEAAIAAGKHIHLDKPPGDSLSRFKSLLDRSKEQGLAVQMGYMYRYNPGVVMLREFLAKGWLGEPFRLHAVMGKRSGAGARKEWALYDGGMMFELGCHLIDVVVNLLGEPEQVTPYLQHTSTIDDGLKDSTLAVFSYPKALATVESSVNEVSGGSRRHLTLSGSEGTFHMQPLGSPNVLVAFSEPRGTYKKGYQEIKIGRWPRYVGDAADLAKIIRGEKATDYPIEHDYSVQRTVLRACGLDGE